MIKVTKVWVKEQSPDLMPLCIPEANLDEATGIFYFNDTKSVHVSNVRSWTRVIPDLEALAKPATVGPIDPQAATAGTIKSKPRKPLV